MDDKVIDLAIAVLKSSGCSAEARKLAEQILRDALKPQPITFPNIDQAFPPAFPMPDPRPWVAPPAPREKRVPIGPTWEITCERCCL